MGRQLAPHMGQPIKPQSYTRQYHDWLGVCCWMDFKYPGTGWDNSYNAARLISTSEYANNSYITVVNYELDHHPPRGALMIEDLFTEFAPNTLVGELHFEVYW